VRRDPWLRRWLPLIAERVRGSAILELGCGAGRDTAVLARAGHGVLAVDRSTASLALAKLRAPSARFVRQDLRTRLPVPEAATGVVVASLSLHYFPWAETVGLVGRIRNALRSKGVLLCRLNSTRDRHFGATGHKSIDKDFFLVRGRPKRFFDRESVDRLFAEGWRVLSREETVIDRYVLPKSVWEVVLEKDA
jgi:SAM-dependent methyltransferase